MKRCEFCGREVKNSEICSRHIPGIDRYADVCYNCAVSFDGKSFTGERFSNFVTWGHQVLSNNTIQPVYRNQFMNLYNETCARAKVANPVLSASQSASESSIPNPSPIQNPIQNPGLSTFQSAGPTNDSFSDDSSNTWITVCRVLGYISIILNLCIGAYIGYKLDSPIIGGIVGFFVGFVSCAFFMMITSLCEDVAIIRSRMQK